jgi:hypothetical protein
MPLANNSWPPLEFNATLPSPVVPSSPSAHVHEFDAASNGVSAESLSDFKLLLQLLACVFVGAVLFMASVTIVLIFTVKRLQLLIGVMRTETRTEGVRAGLLEADAAVLEDGRAAAVSGDQKNGGGARAPKNKSSRKKFTDTDNTSCGIAEVDEEEDHRL